MFYLTAIAFYPALLLLIVPAGSALVAMVGRDDEEAGTRAALAPIIGLAALSVVIGLLLHLRLPASSLLPTAVALNLAAAARLWFGRGRGGGAGRVDWRLLTVLLFAGWLAYLILLAPLFLSGRFGVLGYKVNNDPVFHSIMPEYLDARGYDFSATVEGGFADAAVDKFVTQGYPDGWHQVLLLAMRLFGRRAWLLFNFTEAFVMALTVPVAYAWLRRGRIPNSWSIFGALIATVGYIQMTYLFQGFAPQVAVIPFIYACLYLFYEVLMEKRPKTPSALHPGLWATSPYFDRPKRFLAGLLEGRRRWAAPAALLVQASLAVYSFTVLIWLLVFIGALLVYRLLSTGGRRGLFADVGIVALIGLGAAAMNPFTLVPIGAAFKMVWDWSAANSMGNLVSAHVPILPVFGIWPTGDHRGVPAGWLHPAAYPGALLVIVLIVIGLKGKENRPWLWLLAVAAVVPAVALKVGASPYYFAKTLQVAAPVAAIAAAAGLARISAAGRRGPAVFLALVYLAGLGASDYAAVRFTAVTPAERFAELTAINERFAGTRGLTLFVDTGEDWGKYLLANLKTGSPFALSYRGPVPGVRPVLAQAGVNDIDSLRGIVSRRYSLIVIAKSQDISLPPPPYEPVYAGRFYNVYRAAGRPGGRDILSHRPFEIAPGSTGAAFRELKPGETIEVSLRRKFVSLLISAYLRPETAGSAAGLKRSVAIAAAGRSIRLPVGSLPAVYDIPLAGDSGTVLRVKNSTPHILRLDWLESMGGLNDREALFRYNKQNARVRRAIGRSLSR